MFLVTTGTTPDDSAASYLRSTERSAKTAQQLLNTSASTSTNKTNQKGYQAFLGLKLAERISILDRVFIIDAAPTITDLNNELKQEIYWAVEKEYHEAFLDRLEGWWFRRILVQLTNSAKEHIGSVELEKQMSDLREQFKNEALPIDDDLLDFELDDVALAAHENWTFVYQLDIIKAGKRRIAAAIRDYYRAFEQRSRWLREDLVAGMDLRKYEKRLKEEWEIVFESIRDELGNDATEITKEKAARSVLKWAERSTIHIRTNVTEPFICRGSLHMLADEVRIGWHPEFQDRLTVLLESVGGD